MRYDKTVRPGQTHCGNPACSYEFAGGVEQSNVCPNCGKNPFVVETEEDRFSRETGESVVRILTKEDERADKTAAREHIDDFKKKMGWDKNNAA